MSRIDLTPVAGSHVGVLAELHRGCFIAVWDGRAMAKLLAMPGAFGWLALKDGAPIGFALARVAVGEAEILTLGVMPACRRAGIGRGLAKAIVDQARGHGAQKVFLEVAEDNGAALALYTSLGFTAVSMRPGYYLQTDNTRTSAYLMSIDFAHAKV